MNSFHLIRKKNLVFLAVLTGSAVSPSLSGAQESLAECGPSDPAARGIVDRINATLRASGESRTYMLSQSSEGRAYRRHTVHHPACVKVSQDSLIVKQAYTAEKVTNVHQDKGISRYAAALVEVTDSLSIRIDDDSFALYIDCHDDPVFGDTCIRWTSYGNRNSGSGREPVGPGTSRLGSMLFFRMSPDRSRAREVISLFERLLAQFVEF